MASELGACPLSVDTFLFRVPSKTFFIASYSGENYFSSKYEGMQPDDLKSLFPKLVEHLKCKLSLIKNLIQSAKELSENRENVESLLKELRLTKGLSDKFHTKLFQEIKDIPGTTVDRWSFANKVALIAKDFDAEKRIKIETVAGRLIGLTFEKD